MKITEVKKGIIIIIGLIFALILGVMGKEAGIATFSKLFGEDISSHEYLSKVAENMNKDLPAQPVNDVRLIHMSTGPRKLIYNMQIIGYDDKKTSPEMFSYVSSKIKKQACANEFCAKFLKKGIYIEYSYNDESGMFITNVLVSPSDCGY